MVPSLDANRNDIQADQEELVDPTVDASKVPIEDIRILVVPMDCSDVQDGMSPFPILPFDELQYKKVCFNMQSLTFTILIEPSLDKDKVRMTCKILLRLLKLNYILMYCRTRKHLYHDVRGRSRLNSP